MLLKGTGLLNAWNWPDIPGIHDFKGPYMHSAQWDHTFDWTNKRVALIGGGSSGVQILPQIQPKAQKVIHFMKGKNWISPVGYGEEEGRGLDRGQFTKVTFGGNKNSRGHETELECSRTYSRRTKPFRQQPRPVSSVSA